MGSSADDVAWRPGAERIARSRLLRFADGQGCASVAELRQRSAADPEWFWAAMVQALGITWTRAPEAVLDLGAGMPWARWFPGAGYNYTRDALDRWVVSGHGDAPAIIWEGEDG